jgi:hypothetical protein
MNTYVKSFESINESMKQYGIVLIKGKPRGKNGEPMLYAAHVNTWAELRPGAVMLFLSDIFYRIIKDGDKLKGVKINWRDEDSLKAALNFKAPGRMSVVRNNNKTPYHWKTLKHTSLRSALDAVEGDFFGSEYIFESESSQDSIYEIVANSAIDSIFRDGKNVVVLDWTIPSNLFSDSITGDDYHGTNDIEWEVSFDCIYVGQPEMDEKLEAKDLRRFELMIWFDSEFSYNLIYDPGDRDTPPDSDTDIFDITTKINSITVDGEEVSLETDAWLDALVSDMDDYDISSFIRKKHSQFI